MDAHDRGSAEISRCPVEVGTDGEHGYCGSCIPQTNREALRQAVIHGAPLAGISVAIALQVFDTEWPR